MLLYLFINLFFFINVNALFINENSLINLKLKTIEFSTEILPKVDIVGHKILEQNKFIINLITHNENISLDVKKNLILEVIKFTQFGDNFGNIVLQNYEHLVNLLL